MILKKIGVLLPALLAGLGAVAQQQVFTVDPVRGEKWWGVYTARGPAMPFAAPFEANTADGAGTLPLLLSGNGRYVWCDAPANIAFDGDQFTLRYPEGARVDLSRDGRTLREAYLVWRHKYFPPTRVQLSETLFTRPVYLVGAETGSEHTAAKVIAYADRVLSSGLPAGVLVIPDGWQAAGGNYAFDPLYYPDPKTVVDELHAKGFEVVLTVTPLVDAAGREYVRVKQRGVLLTGPKGEVSVAEGPAGYRACLDFARKEVALGAKRDLARLRAAYGVDGFRFDAGSAATLFAARGREAAAAFAENWMSLADLAPVYEYLASPPDLSQPYVWALPARGGAPEALAGELNDALTAGLCGMVYTSVAGAGTVPEKLYRDPSPVVRSLQMRSMMAVCVVDAVPWKLQGEAFEAVKRALWLKPKYADYMTELLRASATTAEPLVRSMEYQFPRNGFADCNDQFMLGGKYLVAPVLDDAASRTVRLPRGIWLDPSGKRFRGPLVLSVPCDEYKMHWFELTTK